MKVIIVSYPSLYGKEEREYCIADEEKKMSLRVGLKVLVLSNQKKRIARIVSMYDSFREEDLSLITSEVLKVVTKKELIQNEQNQRESKMALFFAQQKADELGLTMRFFDAYYTFDRKQLFLSYVADSRVDFRELAKILAQKYKTRIELRQIGVRDKAKKIGGLGPCGLFLCCNAFLTDFVSVSINMAKNQFLALNPNKINGLCGRLLCCLNYEDEVYTELKKGMPSVGSLVETKEGRGRVSYIDIFKKTYQVEIKLKGLIEVAVGEESDAGNLS